MAIWNLGSINVDHVYRLDSLPLPGQTLSARSYAVGLGGKGANQSTAAARAGAKVHHLGALGRGDDWVLRRLMEAGVICDLVAQLDDQVTGHAVILLDAQAENAIVVHAGANFALQEAAVVSALADLGPADTLLVQNETNLQVAAARAAQGRGARVIYSAAPFDLEAVRAILPHVTILAMNAGEAEQLFAGVPGDLPVQGLLVTRGAQGAAYHDLTTGQVHEQPAFPVTPVDTTGAGDTFTGFFAAALDQGTDVAGALLLSAAAAALQVTRPGAGEAIPTRAEVTALLADQPM